jgi:serine/threonine-protein kinase
VGSEPETFGRYTVLEEIGTGGLSTVHLAEEQLADGSVRRVALKRLLPRVAAREEFRKQFALEADMLRFLKHPNIAATYAAGNVREVFFIAMEYVPGPTLKQLMQHVATTIGIMPTSIVLGIAAELCNALDHAHRCCDEQGKPLGIVHRDVSPQNVIFSNAGIVKLIDFGLVKTSATRGRARTEDGVIKGKINYVAPEYLTGKLDARADLWALGVMMYELLTSRRLFDGPEATDTVTRVRKLPIPRPSRANPRVPPEVDDIVLKALERDPRRRWRDAATMRSAIGEVIKKADHSVDRRHVAEWVRWVFTQKPGTEATGVSQLMAMKERSKPPPVPSAATPGASKSWFHKILPRGSRR